MKKISEFFSLLWTRAVVTKQQFVDFLMTSTTYYGNFRFAKIDMRLLMTYWRDNPFRISRHFLQQKGAEEIHVYGETPLTSMNLIVKKAEISKDDTVLELGCGRGRACFWLHEWIGCKVVGIEQVSTFVDNANAIKEYFDVKDVTFIHGDYETVDWGQPSFVYLYASNLKDEDIQRLGKKMRSLPKGTKVISVSYPIPGMDVLRRFQVPFTWGDADVFIQYVN